MNEPQAPWIPEKVVPDHLRKDREKASDVAKRLQEAIDTHSNLNIMTVRESISTLLQERRKHLELLKNLSRARPLLLYGEAWVIEIEALLKEAE